MSESSNNINNLGKLFGNNAPNVPNAPNAPNAPNTPTPTIPPMPSVESVGPGKTNNKKGGMGNLWIGAIVMIVFVIVLIAGVYSSTGSSASTATKYEPILITAPVNAYDPNVSKIPAEIPNSVTGLEYSYSFWIYVSDYTYKYGQWKSILSKGRPNSVAGISPEISLYPNTNALHIRQSTTLEIEGADVQNIPLKKWNHIVVILNNRSLDVYINGFLERSVVLKGIPILNNAPLAVCRPNEDQGAPGFYGQISRLQYYARSITTTEVTTLYQYGPYGSSNKPFNMTFFDNGNIINYSDINPNTISKYNDTMDTTTQKTT